MFSITNSSSPPVPGIVDALVVVAHVSVRVVIAIGK